MRENTDRLLQNTEGLCSTHQQPCFFRRSSDMDLCAVRSIQQRCPHRFVLRSPVLLLARFRDIHL